MRYVLYLIISQILLVVTVFAQTEVSGEVSGEWTAEDSPYIVVDSTWIPEGDTLTLTEGTTVLFEEDQGLHIFGRFYSYGVGEHFRDDLVTIGVANDVEHWKGLRFYGRNETIFNYTDIECPDRAIYLESGSNVEMNQTRINADFRAFGDYGFDANTLLRCNLVFTDCEISGGMYLKLDGGTLTAIRSRFDFADGDPTSYPGFSGEGGAIFSLTNCEIMGGVKCSWPPYTVYINQCRFSEVFGYRTTVHVSGDSSYMTESRVDGTVGLSSPILFRDNVVLGTLGFGGDRVEVVDCDIRGEHISGGDLETVIVRNCTLSRDFRVSDTDTLIVDSCSFVHQGAEESAYFTFLSHDRERVKYLRVTRSLFTQGFHYWITNESGAAIIDHNIFVYDSTVGSTFQSYTTPEEQSFIMNNIFISNEPRRWLIDARRNLPEFQYNCVWGFDYIAGEMVDYEFEEIEVDSTNFMANPMLEWFGGVPRLAFNSPCIDAGDPDAELDPDGTRSDIGALPFYQWRNRILPKDNRPDQFSLLSAYPNPFNSTTTLSYSLPSNLNTSVNVYDVKGHLVSTLTNGLQIGGSHEIVWDANGIPSGTYFVRLEAGDFSETRKVMLMK